MDRKWKVLVLLTTLLLFAGSALADELVSLKLGYQLLSPDGTLAGISNGVGTQVDVKRDLNLDDSQDVTAEIALNWGNFRLSLNYLPIEFSGTGTLTVTGTFNGQSFSAGDTVNSKLNIDLYDFGLTYYLINLDDTPTRFQLGLELAVKVADTEIIFNDLNGLNTFSESESVTAPIPTLGARARIALADFLGVTGRIGYMEYDGNHFTDAEAQVEFSPIPAIGVYAGYRYFDLKIDESDLFVETNFSGPFGGVLVRF